jgi:hypothetical protein
MIPAGVSTNSARGSERSGTNRNNGHSAKTPEPSGPAGNAGPDGHRAASLPPLTCANVNKTLLKELAGHDHALDLVGALVDLGDRRPAGSFRR